MVIGCFIWCIDCNILKQKIKTTKNFVKLQISKHILYFITRLAIKLHNLSIQLVKVKLKLSAFSFLYCKY